MSAKTFLDPKTGDEIESTGLARWAGYSVGLVVVTTWLEAWIILPAVLLDWTSEWRLSTRIATGVVAGVVLLGYTWLCLGCPGLVHDAVARWQDRRRRPDSGRAQPRPASADSTAAAALGAAGAIQHWRSGSRFHRRLIAVMGVVAAAIILVANAYLGAWVWARTKYMTRPPSYSLIVLDAGCYATLLKHFLVPNGTSATRIQRWLGLPDWRCDPDSEEFRRWQTYTSRAVRGRALPTRLPYPEVMVYSRRYRFFSMIDLYYFLDSRQRLRRVAVTER